MPCGTFIFLCIRNCMGFCRSAWSIWSGLFIIVIVPPFQCFSDFCQVAFERVHSRRQFVFGRVVGQFDILTEKYTAKGSIKKKFGVSAQHYSFAVKAFVEMVKRFDTAKYEFAIRETKTSEVISDVANLRSELGILYLNDFNRKAITKLLQTNGLEYTPLTKCRPYVYIWKGHPLAKQEKITYEELADYPCLSFEQGAGSSFYFAEEILSTAEYPRTIKANDRATMLNLMVGLNGYTLCSGIICEELNGSDYIAVPFETDDEDAMEIGYITLKKTLRSKAGTIYIEELKRYLGLSSGKDA